MHDGEAFTYMRQIVIEDEGELVIFLYCHPSLGLTNLRKTAIVKKLNIITLTGIDLINLYLMETRL